MPDDTTAESIDYFWAIWKRRWFIVIFTLASLIAAIVVGRTLPKEYKVRTNIFFAPPEIKSGLGLLAPLTMSSYHELAMSPAIYQKIIDTLDLKTETGGKLPIELLKKSATVIGPRHRSDAPKRGSAVSGLLTIVVVGEDPIKITKIANTWASVLTEESQRIRAHEAGSFYKRMQEHNKSVLKRLDNVQEQLDNVNSKVNMTLLRQGLNIKQTELMTHQIRLTSISLKLKEEETRSVTSGNSANSPSTISKERHAHKLAETSKERLAHKLADASIGDLLKLITHYKKAEQENILLNKKAEQENIFFKEGIAISKVPAQDGKMATTSRLMETMSNNSHLTLKATTSVSDADATQKMKLLYETIIRQDKKELAAMEVIYLRNSTTIERLKWEESSLSLLAGQVLKKTEDARMLVSEKTSDVRFVGLAAEPTIPLSPDIFKIVVFTTLFAFFLSTIFCLFKEFIDLVETREKNRLVSSQP